jgi:hypothetical protein
MQSPSEKSGRIKRTPRPLVNSAATRARSFPIELDPGRLTGSDGLDTLVVFVRLAVESA